MIQENVTKFGPNWIAPRIFFGGTPKDVYFIWLRSFVPFWIRPLHNLLRVRLDNWISIFTSSMIDCIQLLHLGLNDCDVTAENVLQQAFKLISKKFVQEQLDNVGLKCFSRLFLTKCFRNSNSKYWSQVDMMKYCLRRWKKKIRPGFNLCFVLWVVFIWKEPRMQSFTV